MILGVAAGLPCETVRPWAASARRVWDGRIVLLTDKPSPYLPLDAAYGVDLAPASLPVLHGVCDVARIRWREIGDFLQGELGPVVITDTRDVVFQANPLTRIGDRLVIGTEGKRHNENAWCASWLHHLAPEWEGRLLEADVLNAGAIGGPAPVLCDFAQTLYHRIPPMRCACTSGAEHMTDQTFVNVLLRDGFAPETEITDDWVFHVRSMDHQRIPVTLDAATGRLLRGDGGPFPIVHQYDLAPQLAHFQEMR